MAQRRARLEGGVPTVTVYEIPDNLTKVNELNCRVFDDKPTVEWAIFIRNNRDRNFSDYASLECNSDCKYDVVVGPVADDTVGLLIRQFSRGTIDEFFLSDVFEKLNDIETGLYLEGSAYIYEMLKREFA